MKITATSKTRWHGLILCTLLLIVLDNAYTQVNLSTENLNAALKDVQRAKLMLKDATEDMQPELLFQLGSKADELAMRLSRHMAEYGETEKGLIDLILKRIDELNVSIQWFPDRKRYFYDGAAFRQYLLRLPDGPRAAQSAYQLLEIGFFKSSGDDLEALQASVKQKQDYLARYADAATATRTRIMLAIEYRDISRIYSSRGNAGQARRFIDQALDETRQVIEINPGTQAASTAEELLESMEDEFQTRDNTEN